jgi:hypothetical protein
MLVGTVSNVRYGRAKLESSLAASRLFPFVCAHDLRHAAPHTL